MPEARPASADDIERIVADYARAARHAIAAGFDGGQIHGANGYLIDQFLRDGTNLRDDAYGGSIDNRLRFMREVVAAVAAEVGIERTGIRLSPIGESQGANDSDNAALFVAAAAALEELGVPWIELREPGPDSTFGASDQPAVSPAIREVYSGKIVLNSDYHGASAEARLAGDDGHVVDQQIGRCPDQGAAAAKDRHVGQGHQEAFRPQVQRRRDIADDRRA